MGRVYLAADVRLKKVPTHENFTVVATTLLTWLKEQPWVVNAVICGSYAAGLHGPRSDLDVFILYESTTLDPRETRRRAQQVDEFLANLAHYHVKVSTIWCDLFLARSAKHAIGEGFASHLHACAAIGLASRTPEPTRDFKFNGRHKPRAVALSYLTYKHQAMEDALSRQRALRRQESADLLTDATKAPFHGVRNVLQCLGEPCPMLVHYDEIIARAEAHPLIFDEDLVAGLRQLRAVNQAYNDELSEQLRSYNAEGYQRAVDKLGDSAVLATTLLHRLLVAVP